MNGLVSLTLKSKHSNSSLILSISDRVKFYTHVSCVLSSDSDSDSDSKSCTYSDTTSTQESSVEEWQISREKSNMMVKILEGKKKMFAKWKQIFATSCVFAVSLDPLFLYIPIINQDMNCLRLDQNLKIAALTLRSVTDLFYIMDIIIEIYTSKIWSSLTIELHHISKSEFLGNTFLPTLAKKIWRSYILIDIVAILPLPQVLILILFKNGGFEILGDKQVYYELFCSDAIYTAGYSHLPIV
ncbi:cyclic nucleotide-gated ion channel 1-like [Prunus yedoensis var. nudiflora]|uniref:Cyclic nucleotide-gated ion channel 1-like n=1 Tax=Prunus yedoensis var. nudiflora TaxID=2094558 RepID=A0A314ZPZ0_PRUYE|nr:cyclic nucleotide-gated ion channel 1-like [Prunus yedoensis var. nudiflora]